MQMGNKAKKARDQYMREYMREYMKKWRKKNPEKVKESTVRYWEKRAKQMGIKSEDPVSDHEQ